MTRSKSEERVRLDKMLAALADAFAKEGRVGGDAAATALRAAKSHPYRDRQGMAEPSALLEMTSKQPDALPLATALLACRNLVSWWHWTGEGLARDISSKLYVAELLGPDGHFDHNTVRVGFLISDKATDYPISRHSGEETYLVISGVAEWSLSGGPYKAHLPGTMIHHPSWAPHGRRTLKQPFLGAWRWSGDLDFSSFSVDAV